MELKEYRLTVGYTYYNEPKFLQKQIEYWNNYPEEIQIILVDDGSQKFPASEILNNYSNPNFQLYRVTKDLGFNSHGCRNLIATLASSQNILFMDIDCFLNPCDAFFLKKINFNPNKHYKFNLFKQYCKTYQDWPGHHNIFLINKETFWKAGGYDESFTKYHKGDREFIARMETVSEKAKISKSLTITLERGGRKTVLDPCVDKTTYDDENMLLKIPEKPPSEKELIGKITTKINFPYERIL